MDLGLNGKAALVTGASAGIGKAVALGLLDEGASVSIVARGADGLAALRPELERYGERAIAIAADVTKSADIARIVEQTTAMLGPIDILVNNAGGIGAFASFEDLTDDDWRALFELNLFSVVALTRAVLPSMRARRFGRIINMSSESGTQPDPMMPHYNASKGALDTLGKSLSKAYGADNILVNTVSPAFIMTPLVETMMQGIASERGMNFEGAVAAFLKENRPHIELKRAGRAEEVAAAVCFLASERASFITGTNVRVDGGSVASI